MARADDTTTLEEPARVVPLDPVVASMMRHPAGKRRRREGYPPTGAPKLRAVNDKR